MRFEIHVHVLYICKLHNKYMLNMPMFLTFRTVCFLFNWYIFTYSLITQTSPPAAVAGEESWEDELMSVDGMDAYYYKLNLDPSNIQLVDTKEKYHECISRLSQVLSYIPQVYLQLSRVLFCYVKQRISGRFITVIWSHTFVIAKF